MKRKLIFAVACACAFAAAFFVPARAERPLHVTHHITIEVECLQAAIAALDDLAGQNLNSQVNFVEVPTLHNRRNAHFTRRVEGWAFRHVQAVLRTMGDVQQERESAVYMGGELRDNAARMAAITREIDRLSIMMAYSTTLDVLIAIDRRLAEVMRHRNSLTGQRNVLLSQTSAPVVSITLIEFFEPEEEEEDEIIEPGFAQRMQDAFTGSIRNIRDGAVSFAIFVARTGLSFLIWLAVLATAGLILRRIWKKHRPTPPTYVEPTCVESTRVEGETRTETKTEGENNEENNL